MRRQNVNVFPVNPAMVLVLLLFACSSKKEGKKEEAGKMEMADTNPAELAPSPVKVFGNVDPSVRTQLNGFLQDYFAINQALIEDNKDGAKAAAKKFSEAVTQFDMSKLMGEQMDFYHVQLAKLTQSLKAIDESSDIEETRMEFATLSEVVYALAKAYHPQGSELYFQFCPMVKNGEGANWLSSTKEIINPFMGQRMQHCGRTQETIH